MIKRLFLSAIAGLAFISAAHADQFTVTITDPAKLAGISKARAQYNAALAPVVDKNGNVIGPSPNTIATDAAYIQFVMDRATDSYAKQYP